MFRYIFIAATCLPLIGIISFWADASRHGWMWLNPKNLKMYVDSIKTFLTASGLAVAIVVASLGGKFSPPLWLVQRSVVGLVTCVVFAPITVIFLYRCYERAMSRYHTIDPKDPHEQGELSGIEFTFLLLLAYITIEGFILGFVYLARIPFWL